MMYIRDDGTGVEFGNEEGMIAAIKGDRMGDPAVSTAQRLRVQEIIARGIRLAGGSLFEDSGKVMEGLVDDVVSTLNRG